MEASKKLLELAQQQAQADQSAGQANSGSAAGQDDVVDADFKEVDDEKK